LISTEFNSATKIEHTEGEFAEALVKFNLFSAGLRCRSAE
jgi:hypothetical protein